MCIETTQTKRKTNHENLDEQKQDSRYFRLYRVSTFPRYEEYSCVRVFFAVPVGSVSVIVVRAYQQSVERHGGDFWWWFNPDNIIIFLLFWGPIIGGFITACILSLVEYLGKMYTDYKIGIVNKSAEHDWEPIDTYDEER